MILGKNWLFIVPCSARKTVPVNVRIQDIPLGNQDSVGAAWLAAIERASPVGCVTSLYMGRGFRIAAREAVRLKADLAVLSAGLGFLQADTQVPAYDLTVAAGNGAYVGNRVMGLFDPHRWWQVVSKSSYAAQITEVSRGYGRVLLCLSAAYARMIGPELIALAAAGCDMRLFGPSLASKVPAPVRRFVMPYDTRLTKIGANGTQSDAAHRALLDYTNHVAHTHSTLPEDIKVIQSRLGAVGAVPLASDKGIRLDDDGLRKVIRELIPRFGWSCSQLLSHLRQHRGIACEQSRLAKLIASMRGGH